MIIRKPVGCIQSQGFTLIEILVVLVITGITLSFALLSFGDFGKKRRTLIQAEQFAHFVESTRHRAILEGNVLGFRLSSTGYTIMRLHPDSHWKTYNVKHFPNNTHIKWHASDSSDKTPQLIFYPSGDMTSFKLGFYTIDNKLITAVNTTPNGNVFIHSKQENEIS